MGVKEKNVFFSYLDLLGVRNTDTFSSQYFNEHPHKYNRYGLSRMLSVYGIENAGIRIDDRENDLFDIELPFIAHTGSRTLQAESSFIFYQGCSVSHPSGVVTPDGKTSLASQMRTTDIR